VANIEIDGITKTFESKPAVSDVSFEIEDGEFVSLLGPSGCGKTTLLRCIIGLLRPDEGRIAIGGQVMFDAKSGVDIPTEKRGLGMVFQSYALWPHLRVADNVGYPLKLRGLPRSAIDEKVRELLELVDLSDVAERFPRELSGGQQQRVALCRALASQPKLLLMDEPLSNLDAKLRERVRFEIKNVQRSTGVTILYVTHDQPKRFRCRIALGS
jgi:ABC-type spermidine/putrescine transport systems, ATPase components